MLILRTIKTIANDYKSIDYNLDVIRQTTVWKISFPLWLNSGESGL